LPISRFYSVLVELPLSFVAGSARLVLFGSAAAIRKPVGRGRLLRFAAFLPFPCIANINDVAHPTIQR
jgi:hypothetical protein